MPVEVGLLPTLIIQYLVAQPHTLIAYVHGGTGYDLVYLADAFSAKRAADRVSGFFQQGSFTLDLAAFGDETVLSRIRALIMALLCP